MDWIVLQLSDSAFPTGGFAHSSGLEVAVQAGEVRSERDVARYARESVRQTAAAMVPFVSAAHASAVDELLAIDRRCEAFLTGHVGRRASRTQGRVVLDTAARIFPHEAVATLRAVARARGALLHHAPWFGAIVSALGVDRRTAQRLFLHQSLRGVVSAAVRLGAIGPHAAQRLQHDLAPDLDAALAAHADASLDDAAWTAPLHELFSSMHDRLYSRLFLS